MPERPSFYAVFKEDTADMGGLKQRMRLAAKDLKDRVFTSELMILESEKIIVQTDRLLKRSAWLGRSLD